MGTPFRLGHPPPDPGFPRASLLPTYRSLLHLGVSTRLFAPGLLCSPLPTCLSVSACLSVYPLVFSLSACLFPGFSLSLSLNLPPLLCLTNCPSTCNYLMPLSLSGTICTPVSWPESLCPTTVSCCPHPLPLSVYRPCLTPFPFLSFCPCLCARVSSFSLGSQSSLSDLCPFVCPLPCSVFISVPVCVHLPLCAPPSIALSLSLLCLCPISLSFCPPVSALSLWLSSPGSLVLSSQTLGLPDLPCPLEGSRSRLF